MIIKHDGPRSPHQRWAEFRFSVIGSLLASPPGKGLLQEAIKKLSEKEWIHPITKKPKRFEFSTIEGWLYTARNEKVDTVKCLQSKVRSDFGSPRCLSKEDQDVLKDLYAKFPCISYQLYSDNLKAALLEISPERKEFPSYATVRRYMQGNGLLKRKLPRNPDRQAALDTLKTREQREVRSYESDYVHGLWHLDFHESSIKVLDDKGIWRTPSLLGVYDDRSRLACHIQWYLHETTENLVHGFCQALQKRGLPREVMSDNGSAMKGEEFESGLIRLGMTWSPTANYSPNQNGKCENKWGSVEDRLLAMLRHHKDLTFKQLNDISQAWVEMEYNRLKNRETGETPIDRFINSKDVGRPCPDGEVLKQAFRIERRRVQRLSDGTISLEGCRYEIPSRYRSLLNVTVKYARWDLGYVHMVDPKTGAILSKIYPIDKSLNASGQRRVIENPFPISPLAKTTEMMPHLKRLISDYKAVCPVPSYLPKDESRESTPEIEEPSHE